MLFSSRPRSFPKDASRHWNPATAGHSLVSPPPPPFHPVSALHPAERQSARCQQGENCVRPSGTDIQYQRLNSSQSSGSHKTPEQVHRSLSSRWTRGMKIYEERIAGTEYECYANSYYKLEGQRDSDVDVVLNSPAERGNRGNC